MGDEWVGELTPRQREVWDAIVQFREEHDGKSPSFRELAALIGVSSTNAVSDFVAVLTKKGWLRRDPGSRGLTPIGPAVASRVTKALALLLEQKPDLEIQIAAKTLVHRSVQRVSEARQEATQLALDVLVEAGLVTDLERAAEVLRLGKR